MTSVRIISAGLLIALLLLCPCRAISHTGEQSSDSAVTVDERLGAKLPQNLVFRDENGQQLRLADLVTTPTIILPVYYSCSNVCYSLQWGLAHVLPQIKSVPGSDYRVVSISFDENETPQLAAKFKRVYLTAMHTPFPEGGWRFLTGDAANIRQFTEAVGYRFQRRGADFIHPVASMIVSSDGTIVRYLYGTTFLPKDLSLALIEARSGTSGTTIRKMMEYCFTFDTGRNTYVFNLLRVSATVVILSTGSFLVFLIVTGRKRK
ncbi:MAG: SCO family protein [Desulfuromonadaceae bacterium]|nr:SCO family protein [Desulfuromonadaceae bacterium]